MKLAASLLALVPLACASATAAPPAPAAACKATGKVVIRIEHRISNAPSMTDTLYATGAWIHETHGEPAEHVTGCAPKADVDQLDAGLRAAKFTATTARVRCMAMSTESTVFIVGGKEVFTRQLCSGKSLDAQSQAQLDAATKIFDAALAKP